MSSTDEHSVSSAAQAALIASAKLRCLREWTDVNDPPCHPSDENWNGCYLCVHRAGVAAALRAAATCLPLQPVTRRPVDEYELGLAQGQAMLKNELISIADEIEIIQ